MRLFRIVAIFVFCSLSAVAQTTPYAISGTVTDPSGAVIPGAKVTATLRGAQVSRETVTNESGDFSFSNIEAGKYTLTVTAPYFPAEAKKLVVVPNDKLVEIRVQIPLGLGCDDLGQVPGTVTDGDMAEIVRSAFIDAISSSPARLSEEQEKKGVVVSTANIKSDWLKDIPGQKVNLLSQSRVQQKADIRGDYLYISFGKPRIKGLCVSLEIANTWAVGRNSDMVYLSGGGARYEFRRENGKWVKRFLIGWVS